MNTDSNANQEKPDTTGGNPKSGSKVAAQSAGATFKKGREKWAGRWSNLAADHLKRWEKRLYVATSNGDEIGKLAARLQHLGKRHEFRFNTTNRAAAAAEAQRVFRFLKSNGWEATLAKYKPTVAPKLNVTIGDYLATVEATGKLRLRTFLNYRNCLHTIVAEVFGIRLKKGENKFDYKGGGNQAWIARIDGVRLERLTPDRVNQWKRRRITRAGHSPTGQAAARRTINTYIRSSRSLFSPSLMRELKGLALPKQLPFDGVELEESGSVKYVSKINAQAMIAAARNELKAADPEAYKAFLLGLFAGMRKGEIDLAEWGMLDFAANVIRLEETQWLHLKSDDSTATITVDPEVIAELRALMPPPTDKPAKWSQFILASEYPPRPESKRAYYRAEETFDRLNTWLRSKGITANKPLHELRKEVGALITTAQGIYAASKFLRHSDITTTDRHYSDLKNRVGPGLGAFLDVGIKAARTPADKLAEEARKLSPEERARLLAALAADTSQTAAA